MSLKYEPTSGVRTVHSFYKITGIAQAYSCPKRLKGVVHALLVLYRQTRGPHCHHPLVYMQELVIVLPLLYMGTRHCADPKRIAQEHKARRAHCP